MIVRPLDENGDFMPIQNLDQMIEGSKAVKQIIDLRLTFYSGEWWEDPDIGFSIPEFLTQNARSGDVEMLGRYISSYISNTQGVKGLQGVTATYDHHEVTYHCEVLTEDDEEEEVEVDLDELL